MKNILLRLLCYLPTKLPQGMTEFETWASSILTAFNMPDNDSTHFALAVAILHLDATSAYKPRTYFGKILIKGAASQIAGAKMQELKERHAAQQSAEAAKSAEATANQAGTSTDATTAPASTTQTTS